MRLSLYVCCRYGSGPPGDVQRAGRQRESEGARGSAQEASPPEREEEEPDPHRALHR